MLRGVNSRALPTGRWCGVLAMALLCMPQLGCIAPGRTLRDVPPGEWSQALGDARRAPFAAQLAPEAPEEEWRRSLERGVVSAPILHEELLIIPATSRVLFTVSAADGRRHWQRRFNGPVTGTALRRGDHIFIATATRDGRVYALDARHGRRVWDAPLRGPATGEPVLAGDRVIVSSVRSELSALHVQDGRVLWRVSIPGVQLGAPVVAGDAIVLATARDTLVRIATSDGRVLATRALPATPSAALALHDSTLLVPLHSGLLAHYSLPALDLVRVDTLAAPVLAAPVVAGDGTIYVLTGTAEVWRIDGRGATRMAALGGSARESFTLAANGLLVGRLDGTLFLLRPNGTEVWRREFRGSLRAPVVLGGGAAYVSVLNGDLVKLR